MTLTTGEGAEQSEGARRLGFVPAFDGLRGLAVLLVIAYHFRLTLDPWTTQVVRVATAHGRVLASVPKPSHGFAGVIPKGGFLGVDIFFVLSGFLITALLLREQATSGRISFTAFYRRRAKRLLPALFFFAGGYLVFAWATHVTSQRALSAIISVLFYWFNWKLVLALQSVPPAIAHLWSLSVEEQFYLVWPLITVFILGARRRCSVVIVILVSSLAAIAIWRVVLLHNDNVRLIYFRTDARADSLLMGALAAHLWFRSRVPAPRVLIPAAWCASAFLTFCVFRSEVTSRFLFNGGFTAIALAVAIILLAIVESPWRWRALALRPLRAIGRVSYGLYLWSPVALNVASQHMGSAPLVVRITAAVGLTLAATLCSWYLVERRFMSATDRRAVQAVQER